MTPHTSTTLSFFEWKYLDAYLVWIYEGPPQASGKRYAKNSFFTAWLLLEGTVHIQVEKHELQVQAGQWVLLPPGVSYRNFSESVRMLSIHFEARWITGRPLFELDRPIVEDSLTVPKWRKFCEPMLRRVQRDFPDAYNELPRVGADYLTYADIQGRFQRWLASVIGRMQAAGVRVYLPKKQDTRALNMRRWLDAHSLESAFRLQELSKAFGVSAGQVNRIFIANFEVTPKQYYESRRLNVAKAKLASSAQAVKAISYLVGFRHQSEFTAWFKKHTQYTPSAYRAMVERRTS
ncbi:AraC family transcriptional regulator [Coraliomargarita sp. SDUM461003]|uniref:AraC family transcriptional regulator n=1 Tax=Thalassobacterium maritimum TaxID=3041265 RepID=A0ABU1ARW0_9BACT|nr:AraC family transcriptional regulator [Coraliomargarita sp. SDUM461003]MDQ8206357.1 AraC family transcriptional regulator [Coraliomargarita sp. SDUM461003]